MCWFLTEMDSSGFSLSYPSVSEEELEGICIYLSGGGAFEGGLGGGTSCFELLQQGTS